MIKPKYRPFIFITFFFIAMNFIIEFFLFPGNSNSKYHIWSVAIASVVGGIIGGILSIVMANWFSRKKNTSTTK